MLVVAMLEWGSHLLILTDELLDQAGSIDDIA